MDHTHDDDNCIFYKIVAGQIPSRKVYENNELFALLMGGTAVSIYYTATILGKIRSRPSSPGSPWSRT